MTAVDDSSELTGKVRALAGRLDLLKGVATRAQADEALTRSRLSLALAQAMGERAQALVAVRDARFAAYRAARKARAETKPRDRWAALAGRIRALTRPGFWPTSHAGRKANVRARALYARRGASAEVAALVDPAWYAARYPDVAQSGLHPVAHYLISGFREGRRPNPLFDPRFYAERHRAELAASGGLSAAEHFMQAGAALGLDPHPLFSIAHYVGQAPELIGSDANPLLHYLGDGWRRGVSPHPLFDRGFYAAQLKAEERDGDLLSHYLTDGWRRGLSPHPLFDGEWYRGEYPDIAGDDDEPLSHFAEIGGREGRSPSAWFDTAHYVALRGADFPAGANPLLDYLDGGAWAVGEARPGLSTAAYVAAHPAIAATGATPLEHWAAQGRAG